MICSSSPLPANYIRENVRPVKEETDRKRKPVAIHAQPQPDLGCRIQLADDAVDPKTLFVAVVRPRPEGAHVAMGVQVKDDVGRIALNAYHAGYCCSLRRLEDTVAG